MFKPIPRWNPMPPLPPDSAEAQGGRHWPSRTTDTTRAVAAPATPNATKAADHAVQRSTSPLAATIRSEPEVRAERTASPPRLPMAEPDRAIAPRTQARTIVPSTALVARRERQRHQVVSPPEPELPARKARQSSHDDGRDEPARTALPPTALVPTAPASTSVALPIVMPAPLPLPPRREAAALTLPAQPPAITITIGRIEIRAAVPPPASPQPATRVTRAPPQSLDDYLKARTRRA